MKNILSLLISVSFFSCVSIQEDPKAFIVTENFYTTEKDAESAVISIYNALNSGQHTLYNRLIQISTEMATDDYEAGPRARNAHVRAISNLSHDPSNDRMQEIWRQSYDAINRANIAIEKISVNTHINASVAQDLVNEAKFLRALNYFNLVRWFGDIPLILKETTTLTPEVIYVGNASKEEVYSQIEQDLIDAENLPAPKFNGRADAGAAKSLLSKVYLTQKKWEKAAQKSKEIIDSNWYSLFENFADVYEVSKKNGSEHIFSAQFKGLSNWNGNMLGGSSAPTTVPGISGDYSDALHKEGGLFEAFEEKDSRKYVTFGVEYKSPLDGKIYQTDPHFRKYFDETVLSSPYESSKNTPIIRYAEVLLIYAEALNEISNQPSQEAYAAIDKVRKRAQIETLSTSRPNLSQSDFREAVFEERRKELVYEYQRWFDLSRRGADYFVSKLKASNKTNAQPKHIYFPIPQRELDLNPKLVQNPLWK